MSTRFTIYCETCEVEGPHIRRHHSTAIFMEQDSARFFPVSDDRTAADEWGAFLLEHEYHELVLSTERRRQLVAVPDEPQPTHRLLADGSLEPL